MRSDWIAGTGIYDSSHPQSKAFRSTSVAPKLRIYVFDSRRPSDLFHCDNGGCIEKQKHCDGNNDCPNADDEDDCDVKVTINAESTTKFTKTTTGHEESTVTKGGNGAKTLASSQVTSTLLCLVPTMYHYFFNWWMVYGLLYLQNIYSYR